MTAKDSQKKVLEKHPDARADLQHSPNQAESWTIWRSQPEVGKHALGSGPTEDAAWQDAAKRI
jgi:hypothetical protein